MEIWEDLRLTYFEYFIEQKTKVEMALAVLHKIDSICFHIDLIRKLENAIKILDEVADELEERIEEIEKEIELELNKNEVLVELSNPALRAVAPESIDLEQICATYADCKSCPLNSSPVCEGNYHGIRYKGFRRSKNVIEEGDSDGSHPDES